MEVRQPHFPWPSTWRAGGGCRAHPQTGSGLTYLLQEELILRVDLKGDGQVDGGEHHPADDRGPHPHRQQRVDAVDKEDGPPDALRGTPGPHQQNPYHLHCQDHQDDGVARQPHMVLVEFVAVAHHAQHHHQQDGQREHHDVGYLIVAVRGVEDQHDHANQHQHGHEHGEAALVETEEVALIKALQFLRLELLGPEDLQQAAATAAHGEGRLGVPLVPVLLLQLLNLGLNAFLLQPQLHGPGPYLPLLPQLPGAGIVGGSGGITTRRVAGPVTSAVVTVLLPGRFGPKAHHPAAALPAAPARLGLVVFLAPPPARHAGGLLARGPVGRRRVGVAIGPGLRFAPGRAVLLGACPGRGAAEARGADAVGPGHALREGAAG